MNIDVAPAWCDDTERVVLATILRFSIPCDKMRELSPNMFYSVKNRAIFDAIIKCDKPIDLVSLCRLSENKFSSVEIAELISTPCTPLIIDRHINHLRELMYRRYALSAAKELLVNAGTDDIQVIRHKMESTIRKIEYNSTVEHNPAEMVNAYMGELEARSRGERNGIPTGYDRLDEYINGLMRGGLYVISGRTKMGKTQFAMNIADNIIRTGKKVFVASMEMKSTELLDILFSKYLQVDSKILKRKANELTDQEWSKITEECGRLANGNLIVNDTDARNIEVIEREIIKHNPDVVILDNLNLMSSRMKGSRYEIITEISCEIKRLAMQYNVPILLVAHMNRQCDARPDHHPMMSDLRDSGSVEQDANVVIFVYREGFYNYNLDQTKCEIIIAANRSGQCGLIPFSADLATGTFKEIY